MIVIESKSAKGLCCAYGCPKKKAERQRFCHKHKGRSNKATNLLSYTFIMLRGNAKQRNKVFTLTIEQFQEFCNKTNYLELKGRSRFGASIDRINPGKGYEAGNLQLLTVSDNAKKRWEEEPF